MIIKPYGSRRLVNRYITEAELGQLAQKGGAVIALEDFAADECQRIADGSFTPVEGFCTKAELDQLIMSSKLLSGVFFPIPIYLQCPKAPMRLCCHMVWIRPAKARCLTETSC